jgi:WD40 repeat protein
VETTTKTRYGIHLKLDSVIPLPDGQLIQTRLDWRDNPKIAAVTLYPEDVKIFDADGREVAFEPSTDAIDPSESDSQSTPYGYKTAAIAASGPARLVVNAAEVNYHTSASFTFNPGPNRQPQQVWELNKDLEIDGHVLRILSVTVTELDGHGSLSVDMQSADGMIGAGVIDPKHPALSGGNGVNSGPDEPIQRFWSSFNYEDGLPEGPITLTVSGYTVRLAGPWVVEWTPAAARSTDTVQSAQPQAACLSESGWKAALANPQPLPAELNRKILLEAYGAKTSTKFLSTARLDGSEIKPLIEDGHDASVSPDGSRVVYMGRDGVRVYNLSTAVSELIPDTSNNTGVFRPFWAPDGQKIGFTGTPDSSSPNIFLANLDGSSPKLLANSEPLKLMQGWMPDGRILYVTLAENGPTLKRYDPQSGETSALFSVPQLATPIALSKDGKRLALSWLEQPSGKQILYVFTLDGSQRKPLLELNSDGYIGNLLWTPDGNWLLVDLSWKVPDEPYTKALVQVDTCQIIPVLNLEGSVLGWLP